MGYNLSAREKAIFDKSPSSITFCPSFEAKENPGVSGMHLLIQFGAQEENSPWASREICIITLMFHSPFLSHTGSVGDTIHHKIL